MAGRRSWGSIVLRDGRAYAQLTIDGRRTMRLLRLADERTPCPDDLDEAERAMERLRRRLEAEDAMERGAKARLGEWLDHEYADLLRGRLTPHAADQAEAYIARFADWTVDRFGAEPHMHEITRADVERWCAEFVAPKDDGGRGHRPSYLRRVVNVLRKAWNDALARGFVAENPWRKAPIPRIQATHVPWVSPEDLARLVAAVDAPHRPVIALIAETGLRPSEALALRVEDVERGRGVLHVRSGKTPSSRRSVPLTPGAAAILKKLAPRKDGRLFAAKTPHKAQIALVNACLHEKLPPLTPRSLRHVYASHLVVAGTPPTVVAALLGHADGGALVLRLYGRWFPMDATTQATARLAAFRATRGTPPSRRGTRGRSSGRRRRGPSGDASSASGRSSPSR